MWYDILLSFLFLILCGVAAGLTIGFVSLDITHIKILARTASTKKQKRIISRLYTLLQYHHLVLVALVLTNAIGNEALPIFLARFLSEGGAIALSTTLVLLFGEIIPSALLSGPQTLQIMSTFTPLIYLTVILSFPIAYPLSKILDWLLGEHRAQKSYRRSELKEFLRLQTVPSSSTTAIDEPDASGINTTPPSDGTGTRTKSPPASVPWYQRIMRWWSSFPPSVSLSPSPSSSTSNASVLSTVSDTSSAFSFDNTETQRKWYHVLQRLFPVPRKIHHSSASSSSSSTMYILPLMDRLITKSKGPSPYPAKRNRDDGTLSNPSLSTAIPIQAVTPESKAVALTTSTPLFSTSVRIMSPHPPSTLSLSDSLTWDTLTESDSTIDTTTLSDSNDDHTNETGDEFRSVTTDSEVTAGYVRSPPDPFVNKNPQNPFPVSSSQSVAESRYEQHSTLVYHLHPHSVHHSSPPPPSSPEVLATSLVDHSSSRPDHDDESLSQRELGILEGTLDLRMIPVSSHMIPMNQIFMLSTDDVLNSVTLNQIIETGHSRIPIYRHDNPSDMKGILLVKLLLKLPWKEIDQVSVDSVPLVRPLVLHPRTSMLEALRRFQTGRSHMAIVTKYVERITNQLDSCSNLQSSSESSSSSLPFRFRDSGETRTREDYGKSSRTGVTGNSFATSTTGSSTAPGTGDNGTALPVPTSTKTKRKLYPVQGMITLEDCLEQLLRVPIYDETDFITAHSRSIVYKEMKEKHHHRHRRRTYSRDKEGNDRHSNENWGKIHTKSVSNVIGRQPLP